jgi:hypothetical protein
MAGQLVAARESVVGPPLTSNNGAVLTPQRARRGVVILSTMGSLAASGTRKARSDES